MPNLKAIYNYFLSEHKNTKHDADDLVHRLCRRLRRLTLNNFDIRQGWRADTSRCTNVMLIKPHTWILWDDGAIWDPAIDLMSDFDHSIFTSMRFNTLDGAAKKGKRTNKRIYVEGEHATTVLPIKERLVE